MTSRAFVAGLGLAIVFATGASCTAFHAAPKVPSRIICDNFPGIHSSDIVFTRFLCLGS